VPVVTPRKRLRRELRLASALAVGGTLLFLALGCKGDGSMEAGDGFTTRDSLGITIVENSSAIVMNATTLSLVEDLRIAATDGDSAREFSNVVDLDVAPDGRIYTLDISAYKVRVFDSVGAFLFAFGRAGTGPGEFANEPLGLALSEDSLLVHDRIRFHIFDVQGRYQSTVTQRVTGNAIMPAFARGGSRWLVGRDALARPSGADNRAIRDTFRVVALDLRTGTAGAPIVEIPSVLRWYETDLLRSVRQWMGPEVSAGINETGEVYVADGASYQVIVFSPEGQRLRIIRGVIEPPSYTDAEYDFDVNRELAEYNKAEGSTYGAVFAEGARQLPRVRTRPVTGRMLVAPGGRLLLERRDLDPDPSPRARADTTSWDLIEASGRIAGRVSLPPNIRPLVLTDTHLYAVVGDNLDVASIARYRIPNES
jgi:hypothetical protein